MLCIDPNNLVRLDGIDKPLQCELGVIISRSIRATLKVPSFKNVFT
ncbi:hypothetical protein MtrunA17_Chr3g0111771 [Medicago truncatula]|uniref:Uncharacterized protein n=1 Tax=Medicago truncatula TaxID=3880 RepID=A0A396IV48_MEDTR|nr:hypothetical protein MtrunA17_Chr3g0111771 [Medicago truncatula]